MYLYRHHPEAGLAPQRSWLEGKRCWPAGPEGSRRCRALGERASVAAGVDSEVYWTLRLNEQCCLLCSPTENNEKQNSSILKSHPEKIRKSRYGRAFRATCLSKVCLRGSLGERDLLLSRDGSRLRSSELHRDTSGDRRWRRSLERPLS